MRFQRPSRTPILTLLCIPLLVSNVLGADSVPWAPDLVTAQQAAAQSGKLLMIHFTADTCAPCKRLEKKVFSRPVFGYTLGQQVVPVKVNATRSPDVARQFNVNSWPTDILMTAQGQEIHRMISPQDAEKYLKTVGQFAWRYKQQTAGNVGGNMNPPGAALTPRAPSSRNADPIGARQSVFGDTYQRSPYGSSGLGRRGRKTATSPAQVSATGNAQAAYNNTMGVGAGGYAAATPYTAPAQQTGTIAPVSNQVAAAGQPASVSNPYAAMTEAIQRQANPGQKPLASAATKARGLFSAATKKLTGSIAAATGRAKSTAANVTQHAAGIIPGQHAAGQQVAGQQVAAQQMPVARPVTDGIGLTPGYASNAAFTRAAEAQHNQMQRLANNATQQVSGQAQQIAGQAQQTVVNAQQQVAAVDPRANSDFMKQMAAFNRAAKTKMQNTATADQRLAINPSLAKPAPASAGPKPTVQYAQPVAPATPPVRSGANLVPAQPVAPSLPGNGLQPARATVADAAAGVPSTDIYSPAVVVNTTIPQPAKPITMAPAQPNAYGQSATVPNMAQANSNPIRSSSPRAVTPPVTAAATTVVQSAPPAATPPERVQVAQATPMQMKPTTPTQPAQQASVTGTNGTANQLAVANVPSPRLQSMPAGNKAVDGHANSIPSQVNTPAAGTVGKPANTSGFALNGYDCVALMDGNEWVKGDARWGARHRGQVFLFQTAAAQQSFLADPEKYCPALAGFDAVTFHETGRYEMGSRAHGVRYKDRMFLFTSEESLQRFWKAPWQYSQTAETVSQLQSSTTR